MTRRKTDKGSQSHKKPASNAGLPETAARPDTGQPGSGQGRVDATGTMPQGIRIDPDITEGHRGYEESGPSEIIPAERSRGSQPSEGTKSGH